MDALRAPDRLVLWTSSMLAGWDANQLPSRRDERRTSCPHLWTQLHSALLEAGRYRGRVEITRVVAG